MLYIENTRGGDVSVVDETSYREVKRIPLGEGLFPDDIVGTSDAKLIFLNCLQHIEGHPSPDAAYDNSTIVAVSTETGEVQWAKEVRGQLGHMLISPDDRYLYLALFDMYFVLKFDLQSHEATYIPVNFIGGHGLRLSRDGNRLYVGSILYAEMDVIDLNSQKVIQRTFYRDPVRPFDITGDEATAYVQTSWLHGFHVVDLKQNRISKTIALPPLGPEVPLPLEWPNTVDHGLLLTPDEKKMICVATTDGSISIYSVPELDFIATVPVGEEPSWVITDRSGEVAYVSNRASDTITVVSIPDAKAIRQIEVGNYPQRMWITS